MQLQVLHMQNLVSSSEDASELGTITTITQRYYFSSELGTIIAMSWYSYCYELSTIIPMSWVLKEMKNLRLYKVNELPNRLVN